MISWRGLVLASIVLCSRARAEDLAAARAHYQSAMQAYDVGEYDEAIREFTAAYKAKADPSFLFNLAQAHRLAGHVVEAEHAYRMYLVRVPDGPVTKDVRRLLEELQKEKPGATAPPADPETELMRRHFRAGSELYAREKYPEAVAELEQARAIKPLPLLDLKIARCYERMERLDDAVAGYRHYLASSPADAEEIRARLKVLEERLARKTAPPAVDRTAKSNVRAPAPRSGRGLQIGGIVVGALGLGMLAPGIALGVLAQKESDRLSTPGPNVHYDATGLTYQNAGIGLMVVGGAALVAGVALIVVGRRHARREITTARLSF